MSKASGAQSAEHTPEVLAPVRIWDLPTRIFHWTLATAFFVALATGDSDQLRDVHVFCGYLILALIGARLLWGFVGSRYARFSSFLFGPRAAFGYVKDVLTAKAGRYLGHNPAGSWAVFAMLVLGLLICVSGLVVLGAEESQGILRNLSGHSLGDVAKEVHESLSFAMLALVIVHIAGVLIESRTHRENLVMAMITGNKPGRAAEGIGSSHRIVAIALLVSIALGAAWFFRGRLVEVPGMASLPFVGKQLPDNKLWRDECGSCHVAYHPTLLPARSWRALLDSQNEHFGQSLELDKATLAGILEFLQRNSAETGMTEPAYKINRSIPAGQTPLRITETGYWIQKHHEINSEIWKLPKVGSKANCTACHLDAEKGTYEDAAMRLPQ